MNRGILSCLPSAGNVVGSGADWLHQTCPDAPAPFDQARVSVEHMVRFAANTLAWVMWQRGCCLFKCTDSGAFAGVELMIGGAAPVQLALLFFKSCVFSPISTSRPQVVQPLR